MKWQHKNIGPIRYWYAYGWGNYYLVSEYSYSSYGLQIRTKRKYSKLQYIATFWKKEEAIKVAMYIEKWRKKV